MINGNKLIVYIKSVATILNGEVPDIKDTNFSSDFRPVRYGIVLLAALDFSHLLILWARI